MKLNKIQNIISILVLVVFAFVLITTQMMTNILAKYRSNNIQGSYAQVASFKVDVDVIDAKENQKITEFINYDLTPGSVLELDIKLNGSKNETKVTYKISFDTLDNLPLSITHNDTNIKESGIDGVLAPQESRNINNIKISWISNEENNNYKYSGQIDLITITIVVEQVD